MCQIFISLSFSIILLGLLPIHDYPAIHKHFKFTCWTGTAEDDMEAVYTRLTVLDFCLNIVMSMVGMFSVLIYQHNSLTCWTEMLAAVQKCTIC